MSERLTNSFTNPNLAQQGAWEFFNGALGALAVTYGVNPDAMNEAVGSHCEQVIAELRDEPPAGEAA